MFMSSSQYSILNMPAAGGYFNAAESLGVFGNVNNIGVPPLENVSTTNMRVDGMDKKETKDSSYFDDINSILNNCHIENENENNNKGETRAYGVDNLFHQEHFNMGEWDFEELMKNVSSFPFLDFSFSSQ